MKKTTRLIKDTLAVVLPCLFGALIAIQVHMCRNVFDLRNSYLVENLPSTSDRVWDALSGTKYPHIVYPSVPQPKTESQVIVGLMGVNDKTAVISHDHGFPFSKEKGWGQNQQLLKRYRESVLKPGFPSLTVHYLWCVDGYFELNQYLTILSILDQFRPDKIVIHYRVKPRLDPHGYWRWLEDLERDVVMLSLKLLRNAKYCSHDLSSGVTLEHFPDPHGIFILGDNMITNLTRPDIINLISKSFSIGKKGVPTPRPETLSQSQVFIVSDAEPFHVSQSPGRVVISCPTDSDFNNKANVSAVRCVSMQSYIPPELFFNMDTRFHKYARALMYGSSKPTEISMAPAAQIPNTVHIILDDDKTKVSPLLYLSIKSAFVTGKADKVFIHSHIKPHGDLWNKLVFSDHFVPRYIPTASLPAPNSKSKAIESYLIYTLLQHGGIATLGDALFVKPVSSLPLRAKAIATLQKSQYRQRHRVLDTTVLAAAPGSDFIKNILGMVYQAGQSISNAGLDEIATHVSEIDPKSVLIESFLTSHQVCKDQRCMIAGGHFSPDNTYTTRLLWHDNQQPKSLNEFLSIEGPSRNYLLSLV